MKTSKRALACILSCSMIFYPNTTINRTSAKTTSVKKQGYTISKKAGSYKNSVSLTLNAKKGYVVYYSTGSRLNISKKVKSASLKKFTFKSTTTLKVYAVKSNNKMTASKLKKISSSAINKYKYVIKKKTVSQSTATPTATATSTAAATTSPTETVKVSTAPSSTAVPAGTSSAEPSVSPTATAVPAKTSSAEPSASPTATAVPAETSLAAPSVSPTASTTPSVPVAPSAPMVPTFPTASPTSTAAATSSPGTATTSVYVEPTRSVYDTSDTDTSADDATEITLASSASGSKVTKDNYEISKKNKLTITAPGTYIIHSADNETTDGLIEVKYSDDSVSGTVHLILDGVRLTSSNNTAPDSDTGLITIKNNVTKAIITIADGSTNTLTDTGATGINSDDSTSTTYTAGIVSKKVPLTINGAGTLNITSTYGNGIKCTDDLKIIDSVINVSGPDETATGHNGITGKTGLTLNNATINVHSNNDALKTTLDETDVATDFSLAEQGNIEIDGGSYTVVSENGDGISAYRTLYLNPSKLTVTTKNAASSTDDSSYKGIKAGTTIYVPKTAGTINVDTTATYSSSRTTMEGNDSLADDCIHSNGYIKIDGGTFTLAAGDDAIHSDIGLIINGGDILIKESYEGLESSSVTINNGNIDITSRDDGINAAGDNSTTANYEIVINDGIITIDADGDGIDSNGNIYFNGGQITINGPTNGGNAALDYGDTSDCVCEISGGTLIAAGASGMDVSTTSGSSQPAVNVRFSTTQSANTYVVVKDSSGNTVLTAKPTKLFQSIVLSCSDFTLGNTYTICYGEDLNSLTTLDTVTFSSVSMTVGNTSGQSQGPSEGPGGNAPNSGNMPGGNNRPNGFK